MRTARECPVHRRMSSIAQEGRAHECDEWSMRADLIYGCVAPSGPIVPIFDHCARQNLALIAPLDDTGALESNSGVTRGITAS